MDTRSRSRSRSRSPRSSSPKKMSSPRKTRSVSRKRAASPRKTRSVSRRRATSPRKSRSVSRRRASSPRKGKKAMTPFQKFWHQNKAAVAAAAKASGEKAIVVAHRMAKAAGVESKKPRKATSSRVRVARGRRSALRVLRGKPTPSQSVEQKLRALFSRSPSRYSAAGRRKASPKMRKMRVKKTRRVSSKPRAMTAYSKMLAQHKAEIAARAKATGEKYFTAAKKVLAEHGYQKMAKKTRSPRVRKAKALRSPKKTRSPRMRKAKGTRKTSAYGAWVKAHKEMIAREVMAEYGAKPTIAQRGKVNARLWAAHKAGMV
jgi:hypothetical protein